MNRMVVPRRRERPGLRAFLFHGLLENEQEARSGLIDPYQPTLVGALETFIAYFLAHGYHFVSPADIARGLSEDGYHALLTFDDGYANNLRALPVLRKFAVPGTFFISSNHVAQQKAFWWDALYRERRRRGTNASAIRSEVQSLKRRPYGQIEQYVRDEFGTRALDPVSDLDRPLTPAELRTMAAEPLVTLGNHTADHAILTVCSDTDVAAQIAACQKYLADQTGMAPEVIAYPNGTHDARVRRIARAQGLRLGVVVKSRRNRLPLSEAAAMSVARYFVRPGPQTARAWLAYRSDAPLARALLRFMRDRA